MKITGFVSTVSAIALSAMSTFAHAQDGWIDEARFGVVVLDVPTFEELVYYDYNRAGANVEVLFKSVNIDLLDYQPENAFLQELLNPRPHIGATIALEDNTTSSVYAGLTWHHQLTDHFFVETSFGGAVNDGKLTTTAIPGTRVRRRGLGSHVLFRESIGVGVNITENMNMILQLTHMSHAGLAGDDNAGQTDVALKVGVKF